jgi:hypothetical protein
MAEIGVPGQNGQPDPPRDEITEFEDIKSCGTTGACWILYGFETNTIYPTVQILDVQLDNQQRAVLQRGNEKRVMNEKNVDKPTVAAFFEFNSLNPRKVHLDSKKQNVEDHTSKINHH